MSPQHVKEVEAASRLQQPENPENLSERPSEFLRVEFKTDPVEPATLRSKFLPESAADGVEKVQFENRQVRITRLRWPKPGALQLAASANPSLLVSLTSGAMGKVSWLPVGQSEALGNATAPAGEALRIEFKTQPLAQTERAQR